MKTKWMAMAGTFVFLFVGGLGRSQDTAVTEFSGTEAAKDPANPVASLPFRGSIRCVGGGNPAPSDQIVPPYCPEGTWTVAKGRVLTMRWATSDANTTGYITYFMFFSLDSSTYTGPWWGSFVLEVPGKGEWEGTFTCESSGQRPDGVGTLGSCRLVGSGDGEFERRHFMAEVNYAAMFLRPATVTGRYLPPSKSVDPMSTGGAQPRSGPALPRGIMWR
jgi:hypothetical protein